MVAEHLFWLHVLGLRDPATDRKLANDLLARRRDDGTWSNWWEGPPDLSTTIESYVALKMAGVDAGDETRAYIRREGGVPSARVFTKCFLALLDAWPWQDIPTVPVELILLPPSAPLSVYNFGCWARQTVVPLSVVQALRPVRPAGVDLSEIGAQHGASSAARESDVAPPPRDRRRPSNGCATGRRPTAAGAASSRRGSGRSSCSPRSGGTSTTRASAARSRAGAASSSRRETGCDRRRASRPSGTRPSRSSRSAPAACPPITRSSSRPASGCSGRR